MLYISQNSQVQLLCVHGAWECVGGRMSAWVHVCVCVSAGAAAAAAAVHLLSMRVNYSQHVRQENSWVSSSAASSEQCVTAVGGGADNMANQSGPHQSVFMKTWLTLSVSARPECHPLPQPPPHFVWEITADRWVTAVMTWRTAGRLSPAWIPKPFTKNISVAWKKSGWNEFSQQFLVCGKVVKSINTLLFWYNLYELVNCPWKYWSLKNKHYDHIFSQRLYQHCVQFVRKRNKMILICVS